MRRATAFAAVVFALVFCVNAAADVPEIMSYQGVLRDGSGNPVPDGSYNVTFRLYDVETGGTALWSEGQPLTATSGIINAYLGSVVPLNTLEFDVPYWLAIAIEYGPELTPRTPLTTVPYAGHAAFADRCDEADEDWRIEGDDIYHDVGNVGIGTATPDVKLDVLTGDAPCARFSNGSGAGNFTVRGVNYGGTAGGFFAGREPTTWPSEPAAVFGHGGAYRGGYFVSDDYDALLAASTNGKAIWGYSNANYSGYFSGGGLGVYVGDQLETNGFRMQPGAAYGYVLTSDGSGVGTWEAVSAGTDGDWTITGSDMYSTVPGRVGIGVTVPTAKLEVYNATSEEALEVKHGGSGVGRVVNIERLSMPAAANDALQIAIPSGSPDGCQLIEAERGGVPVFYVMGDGRIIGTAGAYLTDDLEVNNGQLLVDYYGDHVAEISTTYTANGAHVLHVECPDTGETDDGIAVYGKYEQATDFGIGGKFEGGYMGIWGIAENTGGTLEHVGVRARASGSSGYNYGILASASWGTAYSGYFMGNVNVDGTLTADAKNFKIDHPLDPANKYLLHNCVESDEMANVYSGNVTLDARGEARVELPDWFEALNEDFRYQLTCIGGFAPVYVAERISGNEFSIAGGEPGMEVSWQVTGIRHDAYSIEHRMAAVQDKPSQEVGKYRHPGLYGMPETAGVAYHEERGLEAQGGLTERTPLEPFDPTDGE